MYVLAIKTGNSNKSLHYYLKPDQDHYLAARLQNKFTLASEKLGNYNTFKKHTHFSDNLCNILL